MKLFLLSWKSTLGMPRYDVTNAVLVRAKNETEARKLAHSVGGDEQYVNKNFWLEPTLSDCEAITAAGKAEVIIRDFNAG